MTADISAWGTLVLAAAAVAALVFNLRTLTLSRRAIEEARRSRLDARAPRVVVIDTQPVWPAARKQDLVTSSRCDLINNDVFDLPGRSGLVVLQTGYVQLHNEGETSAFVSLPTGSIEVARPDDRPPDEGERTLLWNLGKRMDIRIAPGESQWVLLEAGYTLQRWADLWTEISPAEPTMINDRLKAAVQFELVVSDQFVGSVRDTIQVEICGFPLKPVDGATGRQQARTFLRGPLVDDLRIDVVGTARTYLHST